MIHKGSNVPNALIEGSLLYSNTTRKIYQIGGFFYADNDDGVRTNSIVSLPVLACASIPYTNAIQPGYLQDSTLSSAAVWEFDVDKQVWEKSSLDNGIGLARSGAAAYCDASGTGKSFVFQGYLQRRSGMEKVQAALTVNTMFNCEQFILSKSEVRFNVLMYMEIAVSGMLQLDMNTVSTSVLSNISTPS